MWLPLSSHSLTFSLSLSLLHILSWHFWQWGNLLQGSICWCDSHYPLHSHSFCPTFSLTYTRGERGNILLGAICRSDSHSLLILSLTHCFSHSLTFSILTFPQSRWASKYILHSTLIPAPTPKIAHSRIKYTTKPIHNKTNTQIHTKNKHTNVQIQNVTHLTNTLVSITVPMSVSIACLSISAYFTRAFFHIQQITINLLTVLHLILTLDFNTWFQHSHTELFSFLSTGASLALQFKWGTFRGQLPWVSGRYHQTLALECWHCRSKCTCMALCYSAFVFDQKHVFLLNIHTGHTMLHTVCEQAGSTVCLWMAPHFQTSANGNISQGHTNFTSSFSCCHSVTVS